MEFTDLELAHLKRAVENCDDIPDNIKMALLFRIHEYDK